MIQPPRYVCVVPRVVTVAQVSTWNVHSAIAAKLQHLMGPQTRVPVKVGMGFSTLKPLVKTR